MALQKSIELPSGVTASYWKIIGLSFNYVNSSLQIRIAGYATEEARQENKPFVTAKLITVTGDDYTDNFSTFRTDSRKNTYNYLKAISGGEFENSVDV